MSHRFFLLPLVAILVFPMLAEAATSLRVSTGPNKDLVASSGTERFMGVVQRRLVRERPSWFRAYRRVYGKKLLLCGFLTRPGSEWMNLDPSTGDKCPSETFKKSFYCGIGEQTCKSDDVKSDTHPTTICECDANTGEFVCEDPCTKPEIVEITSPPTSAPIDMVPPSSGIDTCPETDPVGETAVCTVPLDCPYYEESCCGETFPSLQCSCTPGDPFWACLNTDACMAPDCSKNCPSQDQGPNVGDKCDSELFDGWRPLGEGENASCGYGRIDCSCDGIERAPEDLPFQKECFCDPDSKTWICSEILCGECAIEPPVVDPLSVDCSTCPSGRYNDGCNECTCEENGDAACTELACFVQGDPFCIEDDEEPPVVSCATCPSGRYYDGCNQCSCNDDGLAACTFMFCAEKGTPFCQDHEGPPVDETEPPVVDCSTCSSGRYNDGCNECTCDENGKAACTKRACLVQGDPFCTEDDEEPPVVGCATCPSGSYYDGCNRCSCNDDGLAACTLRACFEQGTPSCDPVASDEVRSRHLRHISDES